MSGPQPDPLTPPQGRPTHGADALSPGTSPASGPESAPIEVAVEPRVPTYLVVGLLLLIAGFAVGYLAITALV